MKNIILIVAFAAAVQAASLKGVEHTKALIPELPPTVRLNDSFNFVNNDLAFGEILLSNTVITNLDTLTDTLIVLDESGSSLTITGNIKIPSLLINSSYISILELKLLSGIYDFFGTGAFGFTLEGVEIENISIGLQVDQETNETSITALSFTPSVTNVTGRAVGATLDGEPVNWGAITPQIPAILEANWAVKGQSVADDIRQILNNNIDKINVMDMLSFFK